MSSCICRLVLIAVTIPTLIFNSKGSLLDYTVRDREQNGVPSYSAKKHSKVYLKLDCCILDLVAKSSQYLSKLQSI